MAAKRPNVEICAEFAVFAREMFHGALKWLPAGTRAQVEKSLRSLEELGEVKLSALQVEIAKANARAASATEKASRATKEAKEAAAELKRTQAELRRSQSELERARQAPQKPGQSKARASRTGGSSASVDSAAEAEFVAKRIAFEQVVADCVGKLRRDRDRASANACLAVIPQWTGETWAAGLLSLAAQFVLVRNRAAMAAVPQSAESELTNFDMYQRLPHLQAEADKLKKGELQAVLRLLGEESATAKLTKEQLLRLLTRNSRAYVDRVGKYPA